MKARWILTAICVGAAALIVFPVARADRDDDDHDDRRIHNSGFGNRIAGSYLAAFVPAEGGEPLPFLSTINAEGTFHNTVPGHGTE